MSSDKDIDNGLMIAKEQIMAHLADIVGFEGAVIANRVLGKRSYSGFTGNAQTSYSAITYRNSRVLRDFSTGDVQREPIREKIPKGKTIYLDEPYEGNPRSVTGRVGTDGKFSYDTLSDILRQPVKKDGVTVRFAIGVEYGPFIGNPLQDMHLLARTDIPFLDFK